MNRQDNLHKLVTSWLGALAITSEWSRSINPPGELLHIEPGGPSFLILDVAIEDNALDHIVQALQEAYANIQDHGVRLILRSNLTWGRR